MIEFGDVNNVIDAVLNTFVDYQVDYSCYWYIYRYTKVNLSYCHNIFFLIKINNKFSYDLEYFSPILKINGFQLRNNGLTVESV